MLDQPRSRSDRCSCSPGLVLHLGLQGDVIRGVTLGDNPTGPGRVKARRSWTALLLLRRPALAHHRGRPEVAWGPPPPPLAGPDVAVASVWTPGPTDRALAAGPSATDRLAVEASARAQTATGAWPGRHRPGVRPTRRRWSRWGSSWPRACGRASGGHRRPHRRPWPTPASTSSRSCTNGGDVGLGCASGWPRRPRPWPWPSGPATPCAARARRVEGPGGPLGPGRTMPSCPPSTCYRPCSTARSGATSPPWPASTSTSRRPPRTSRPRRGHRRRPGRRRHRRGRRELVDSPAVLLAGVVLVAGAYATRCSTPQPPTWSPGGAYAWASLVLALA